MIDFKKIELADKQWIDELLSLADLPGCHQNFTNIFAWSEINNYRVARVKDYLVVKGGLDKEKKYYFYPAGQGDLQTVIEEMKQDAAQNQHKFILLGVSPENRESLNRLYPDKFVYQDTRDDYDYVFYLDKLVQLAGKKLQAKRNHINRFKANHQEWKIEEISLDNLAECWEMNIEWCKRNDCEDVDQLATEFCAVTRCFDNYQALQLEGALLRLDGRVIAFTMGERQNSDTYVIHIEKAFGDIQGAYQMINREFAEIIQQKYPQLVYVNREEDMGFEGLRKAKLSYYPDKMEEKFSAEYLTE